MANFRLENTRIAACTPLLSPSELHALYPLSDTAANNVAKGRKEVRDILDGKDHRLMVISGPCSIHDTEAALDYAKRLKALSEKVQDNLLLVMRVYFEKPRTTVGWKGFVNDPDMNDSFDLEKGLKQARQLLATLAEMDIPTATEALDPISPQYLGDLFSWSAIGARTSESQTHREMSSGLSTPVGFKNGTDGSLQIAINAWQSAASPHRFMGIDENGKVSVLETRGNPHGHIILRGGKEPNYDASHVAAIEAELDKAKLPAKLVVDCSHGNSYKNHELQPTVAKDAAEQIVAGNRSILGLMLESHINAGAQKLLDRANLQYGVSITDACIDWETTETLLLEMSEQLAEPLRARTEVSAEPVPA
ncbi:MAG: 3-deoxy-7-phosphoheptulonate synthase [Granulosicoccaceae bacterium]